MPFCTQPLFETPFAFRYTFFSPTKLPLKVSATFNVKTYRKCSQKSRSRALCTGYSIPTLSSPE